MGDAGKGLGLGTVGKNEGGAIQGEAGRGEGSWELTHRNLGSSTLRVNHKPTLKEGKDNED